MPQAVAVPIPSQTVQPGKAFPPNHTPRFAVMTVCARQEIRQLTRELCSHVLRTAGHGISCFGHINYPPPAASPALTRLY